MCSIPKEKASFGMLPAMASPFTERSVHLLHRP